MDLGVIEDDLRKQLVSRLPAESNVTNITYEGPFLVVYSKNPKVLMEDGEIVKNLARSLRKRILIKSDPEIRMDKEQAESIIRELVPADAEITNISFDDDMGDIIIEAKKPGIVIGKNGSTLREIVKAVFWRPMVVRTPPLMSSLIQNIRRILQQHSAARQAALLNIGKRIHRRELNRDGGWLRLTALGGFREVGRSCVLLETEDSRVMIDSGVNVGSSLPTHMFPRLDLPEFEIEELDAVIITHAHLDHSGFTPFLYKYGYRGPLYCTEPTRNLMTLLQIDYLEVAEREGKLSPYSYRDIQEELIHTIPLKYGEVTDITPDIRLTFHNAGHILGSAIVHLHLGEGVYNVAFAHDFKYAKSRLLDPANSRFPRIETLIMESTYGGPRDFMPSRKEAERQLTKIVNETVNRGGKVLIPVLSVGRAQELMIVLDEYIRRKVIPEVPIYLDGMIGEATSIHTCHPEYLSANLRERIFHAHDNPFLSEWFAQVDNQSTRDEIAESGSCVIMATSGMLTGGPSVDHFRLLAPDEKNAVVFVSYQADRTLGRRVQNGAKEIQMTSPEQKTQIVRVNMDVHTTDGFSGHSDRRMLLNYLRRISPKPEKVVLVHGEESKILALANTIRRSIRSETLTPKNLETIRLR